jgi:hypothetical protein
MAQTIGNIQLDLGINSSGFKKQLNSLGKTTKAQTGAMVGMFGKVAKAAAAAFAVKKIVDFSKACIQLGSDLAEVQNVVDVTFGSMSNKVNEFAKDAMTSYGLSEKVAKQYMGTFGAMSKSFGFTTEAAYDQAAALTGLAGDVASFYNLTTDEAYTKLKSVFTGETESLKELGVVMTQTALDEYALQKGMGKTTSQMSEQEKVALRLAFVQDRLATASGDFARTSDGWANQTRVLALRFDALKASIGQGLINVLLPIVRVLNEIIARLQVAADAFSEFTAAIFGKSGSSGSVASVMSGASSDLATNVGDAASSAKAIKKSLAGFDQLNILGGGSGAGAGGGSGAGGISSEEMTGVAESGNKYAKVLKTIKRELTKIAKITGLDYAWNGFLKGIEGFKNGFENLGTYAQNAFERLKPTFETFKLSLTNTFTTIATTLTTIWGDLWGTLGTKFAGFTEEYQPQIEAFLFNAGKAFTDFGTLASDAVGDAFGSLKKWWEADGSRIFGEVLDVVGDVGGTIIEIWNNWIFPVIESAKNTLSELWKDHIKPLWDEILLCVTSIWDTIKALWDKILKPVVDWIVARFGPSFVNVFETIFKTVGDVIGGIIDFIKGGIKSFRGLLDFITGVFTLDWKKAWNGIKTFYGGVWDSMVALVKTPVNLMIGLFEGLVNGVIAAINGIVRAVNKLSFDVPDWVPGIGGEKFGFNLREVSKLSIPRLATGGYVEANSPQLAIIGDNKREGEIVSPESKIAEAVAAGVAAAMRQFIGLMNNKTGQPTPIIIKIGEDDFWSGFIDYHNSVVKRTGDSPLLI